MMHIALCFDDNYAPYAATVMASVVDFNDGMEITFHLLVDGLSDSNHHMLIEWMGKQNEKNVVFHTIDKKCFDSFPLGEAYLNISTYFRLLLPDLLPDVDKILYLDCDVIINNSLKDLWNTDIRGYALAGVRDRINDYVRVYNRLGYPMQDGYVNAGVLLINLERWRKDNILAKAAEIAAAIPKQLKNHDQDIINIVYHGQIKFLDFKYNLIEHFLHTEDHLYLDKKYYPQIEAAIANPTIIHFCMPWKPWHIECVNPFRDLFFKYKAMTPWPKCELKLRYKVTVKDKVVLTLKKLLGKTGLYVYVPKRPPLRADIYKIVDERNVVF